MTTLPVRICVVGSVNLDLVAVADHLPMPGETVIGATFARSAGGKGANQALAARRQGASVRLVAAVGNDALANEALDGLERAGVDMSCLRRIDDVATGVALIVVDARGENQITVASGANHRLGSADVDAAFDASGCDDVTFDAVLCQLEVRDDVLVAAAQRAHGLLCVNAAPARPIPAVVFDRADVIIVNDVEHEALADQLRRFDGLVVVTGGAAGADIRRNGVPFAAAAPPAVNVVDTVGAGDAFCGTFTVAVAMGLDLEVALRRACVAGALACTMPGAQASLPDAGAIDAVIHSGALPDRDAPDR